LLCQRHAASHLHYDFRLAIDGVLKSWAIPKEPKTNSRTRRLAIMTEDHPLEYATFEGTIPEGYGAGTVTIWDTGTYTSLRKTNHGTLKSLSQCLKEGRLEIDLQGSRLQGSYALIRMKQGAQKGNWLFIKMKKDIT
jgi:bifunctional non-homologous end joining protein LigD